MIELYTKFDNREKAEAIYSAMQENKIRPLALTYKYEAILESS